MATTQEHYDRHLGSIYTWMAGGWESAVAANRRLLRELGVASVESGLAVDLGCGSGFQAIPLAEFGLEVLAIDQCSGLLDELSEQIGNLPIRPILDDLGQFTRHVQAPVQVISCMGDTITHLDSKQFVERLFEDASQSLADGGLLVLTFRDYVSGELRGRDRFFCVRSDENRIFTCFLEYRNDVVEVHDLLHQRNGAHWDLRISSYCKLRLDKAWIRQQLMRVGLAVVQETVLPSGMIGLVARK